MVEQSETKPLTVKNLFGEDRFIGDFPKAVMTDAIAVVEKLRRKAKGKGKDIILPANRMQAVEDALFNGSPYSNLIALEVMIKSWH